MSEQLRRLERVNELLAGSAIGDLTGEELFELRETLASLKREGFDLSTIENYDSLAAAIAVGPDGTPEALPAALRARLLRQGEAMVGRALADRPVPLTSPVSRARSASRLSAWSGWSVAAAALLVAAIGWLRPGAVVGPAIEAPTWAQRQDLIQNQTDTNVFTFTPTDDPVGKALAGGDVVWNQRLQRGFLRFKSLAANDPDREQYQLWIFDPGRPTEYPVDGGVFDARSSMIEPSTGDLIVPIDARLLVKANPAAFAVTVEQAGGVVVTDRKRVFALAPTAKQEPKPEPKPQPTPN